MITTELLPCPFCGGEAHFAASSDGYAVECDGELCLRNAMQEHPSEEYAALWWNTRSITAAAAYGYQAAQGTCHNNSYRIDESRFHCSECEFGCWVRDVADGRDKLPAYCPNCGRKVVA